LKGLLEGALGWPGELQTGSTAAPVDSVPWSGSSCLSEELQTWSTAVSVEAVLEEQVCCGEGWMQTGSTGSTVEAVPEIEVRCAAESYYLFDSADTVANGY